jgi:hypothetical protein
MWMFSIHEAQDCVSSAQWKLARIIMGKRNYTEAVAYEDSPKQVKMREERNKARREYEKKYGNLPRTKDVDHIKPLSKKGKPLALSNLRAVSESANRSFSRTNTGGLKSQISKRERAKMR